MGKEMKNKLLKLYLKLFILAQIFFGLILYFIKPLFPKDIEQIIISFVGILAVAFLVFTVYCLIRFHEQKLSKLTYILPIFDIIIVILTTIVLIFSLPFLITKGINIYDVIYSYPYNVVGISIGLIEVIFALYLLNLFKNNKK